MSWSARRFAGGLRGSGVVRAVDEPGKMPAMLAIHGFGCVPEEVELLSGLGVRLGLRTLAPLLPGHGRTVAEFARTRYDDWYGCVEQHFLQLTRVYPAFVGGQSMGAVLALDLASRYPGRCAGVVLFANAVHLASPFPSTALKLASWAHLPDFALPKTQGPDLNDPVAHAEHTTYSAQPFHAARSLQLAGERVIGGLGRIRCPTFIGHGALDRTTPKANAWLVAEQLGSSDVEVHLFPRSGHILTKDFDRESLRERVLAFLTRVLAQRGTTGGPDASHAG